MMITTFEMFNLFSATRTSNFLVAISYLQVQPPTLAHLAFVWLEGMLHHRADPTNAMIGCDNSQTRSPWGVQVKQLTKICWHLIAAPSTPDFTGKVGLNLAICLVTSCCGHQTACWRPAYCQLGRVSFRIGDPCKSHQVWSGLFKKVCCHIDWLSGGQRGCDLGRQLSSGHCVCPLI